MKIILLLSLLALCACDEPRPLTAQEMQDAEQFCHRHHREAVAYDATFQGRERVVAIQCSAEQVNAGGWK